MDHLIAILVMALLGPLFVTLTIATLVAIAIAVARFDVKAWALVPGAAQVLSRIYVIATLIGFLGTVMLLIGGIAAIL